jgi:ADP-ribosylglycohydrolase/5'(3')-deoxyribonucleotidase
MNKKIIYFDMDNVLVDFASGIARLSEETKQEYEGRLDEVPGIFSLMKPKPDAVEAVRTLSQDFDCYILSTASWKNPSAWTDRTMWVQKYFGDDRSGVFCKHPLASDDKDIHRGDILIGDPRTKNIPTEFHGVVIRLGSKDYPDWSAALKYCRTRLQYINCLLGGATGDALGAPIEFMSINEIRKRYGYDGIRDYVEYPDHIGEFTDDTQMTLFTAEGLMRAYEHQIHHGVTELPSVVYHSYRNWLITQTDVFDERNIIDDESWLITRKELFRRRAPGNTCLSALFSNGRYTISSPGNNSKGCGAIMRMAPVGLRFAPDEAFDIACELGVLTHGHPSGYLSAGFFASLISRLMNGEKLYEAIQSTIPALLKYDGHEETLDIVKKAVAMAKTTECTPENIERLGGGWVGEEALAISLYCALSCPDDVEKAVLMAVNHSGDSDSTGSITGNIVGIMAMKTIPTRWLDKLLYRDIVIQVGNDLHAQIGVSNEIITRC